MEQKKKRFRPSLTAYRELMMENIRLKGILGMLGDFETIVRDNAIYRQALINFSAMIRCKKDPAILIHGSDTCDCLIKILYDDIKKRWNEDSNKLYSENMAYERSNKILEDELERVRKTLAERDEEIRSLRAKIFRKKNESIFSRFFKKDV